MPGGWWFIGYHSTNADPGGVEPDPSFEETQIRTRPTKKKPRTGPSKKKLGSGSDNRQKNGLVLDKKKNGFGPDPGKKEPIYGMDPWKTNPDPTLTKKKQDPDPQPRWKLCFVLISVVENVLMNDPNWEVKLQQMQNNKFQSVAINHRLYPSLPEPGQKKLVYRNELNIDTQYIIFINKNKY